MRPLRDTKFLFSCSKIFQLLLSRIKYFSTLSEKFHISTWPCSIVYICTLGVFTPKKLFQNLRCILYTESFVSGAVVDPVLYWYMLNASDWIPHNFIILFFQLTCGKTWEHISTLRSSLRKNSQIFCVLCCVCDAGNFANSMLSIEHLAPHALTKHVA